MLLIDSGDLELDDPIGRFLPVFEGTPKADITVRHLLNHCSGFPAHIKFYEQLEELRAQGEGPPKGPASVDWVLQQIAEMDTEPPGTKSVYSDLGFITLGRLVEKVTSQPLQDFCEEQIFRPLGMEDTFYLPSWKPEKRRKRLAGRQIVVTEMCPWRKKLMIAEVHDENCYSFGGVAGHAGLFSTAEDIHRFALTLWRCSRGMDNFFQASLVQEFWRKQEIVPGSTWALGWDTPSEQNSQVGHLFSRHGVGHLGFTGCSLWIDRDDHILAVFLSNRVHPTRENTDIRRFRPLLHNTLYGMLTEPAPLQPPVEMGRAPELLQVQDEAALSANQAVHSRLRPPPSLRSAFPLSGEQSFDNLMAPPPNFEESKPPTKPVPLPPPPTTLKADD
jgi:CubicO group peptidase (beta-lactamase class C family)